MSRESLAGKRVLVTGGAGFVGSEVTRRLLDAGADVAVYDNFSHGTRDNLAELSGRIAVVVGDVLDEWKLAACFETHRPEYVMHLVSDTYVPSSYDVPKRFFRVNVEGTINVLMAAKMFGCGRILYVSTTEVYGEGGGAMREDQPFAPLNTYAVSKLAADRVCFTFFLEHAIPVVTARIFNAYGPRATQPYVIPEIITQLSRTRDAAGGARVALGNVEARRDFTFVEDTADALLAVLGSDLPSGDVVNVGSGVTYSVREIVELVAELMGIRTFHIDIDPHRLRKVDIQSFRCDPAKLERLTGFRPRVDIREGLRRTVDWFDRNGRSWSWERWVDGTILYDGSV
jgi:nucleoside-diphosphate-sugar epimerase